MPLICYERKSFSEEKMKMIAQANIIISEYRTKGFSLTLRQLYYVFVSHDLFPGSWANAAGVINRVENYSKLGDLISDGRMAGLIDWEAIEDRTRESRANSHWTKPSQIIESAIASYHIDLWENQPHYVEVWVEKEALENVLARACRPLDVRFFACKGYTSQSAMWEASQRLLAEKERGKEVHIIHLGDHDPSGIDMSRDIFARLSTFTYNRVHVQRIALNMAQVEKYSPPPNPAKTTDSRYARYRDEFGEESWELDALRPEMLVELITRAVDQYRDMVLWEEATKLQDRGRSTLKYIVQYFGDVVSFLRERRTQDNSPIVCADCGATQANPVCQCAGVNRGRQL